jgi:transcription-repair coupling factor (superfamily II helicase)
MYLGIIRRAFHESDKLRVKFIVLPEDVLIKVFDPSHIPEDYVSLEGLRLSFYKSLSSASSGDDIDNILFQLTNRFGPAPIPVDNLIHECHLRLLAATAGILSVLVRGCGIVLNIVQNKHSDFMTAVLDYMEGFCSDFGVDFHVLPVSGSGLSVCLHLSEKLDKYSILSLFLNKFKPLA